MKVSNTKFLENPSGTSELFHAAKRTDAYDEGESLFRLKNGGTRLQRTLIKVCLLTHTEVHLKFLQRNIGQKKTTWRVDNKCFSKGLRQ